MSILQPSPISEFALERLREREAAVCRPWLASLALLGSDVALLAAAAALSIALRSHVDARLGAAMYIALWPVLLVFPLAYAASGLYPGFGRNPADELRKIATATSLVYCALAVTAFLLKDSMAFSRAVFLLAWAQSVAAVPIGRAVVRKVCGRKDWWGEQAAVVGPMPEALDVARALRDRPELGVRPVLVCEPSRVPRLEAGSVRHAILVASGAIDPAEAYRDLSRAFRRVTLAPGWNGMSSLWVEARDLGGAIGLEFSQRLLMPWPRCAKRAIDLCMVFATAAVSLPFAAIIAAAIRLTSPGPVFYRQVRYGCNGETFVAWKFRSMVYNAGEVLDASLRADPALRQEWERDHKLRNDPRITPVGRLLRHTSLDELPQIWNVLTGQMSVVGPRPIVAGEIPLYGRDFELYKQVRPGITGLWQVSGRNNVSYQERVRLDTYYIRNWSPWLDLYILARTVSAVLLARGAY
jgi:Undecaprenyl-phosphate galactose phosphotransferase WbaP